MKVESERKFLVNLEKLKASGVLATRTPVAIRQSYLSLESPVVRVRMEWKPEGVGISSRPPTRDSILKSTLTIKGKGLQNRQEFEYEIPDEDAARLLEMGSGTILKYRFRILTSPKVYDGAPPSYWELDRFLSFRGMLPGEDQWLVELEDEDPANIVVPDWVGAEVTTNPAYQNVMISKYGFPVQVELGNEGSEKTVGT